MRPTAWLVIFVKEPAAGRVKTRLGRGIGSTPAAWWFRHQVARLIRRVGHDPRWRTVLAVAPDKAIATRALPAGLPRIHQGPGDLGSRMARVFRDMPPGPVIVIGGDIPDIEPTHIAEAFRALGPHPAVIGPAPDGGYWLIGLKRGGQATPSGMFGNVRWSTAHARADTEHSLGALGIAHVATLADVDEPGDLRTADVRAWAHGNGHNKPSA